MVQHQQLGLISGAIAKACEGEVDEESEAGVKDEEEHGRRLIVVVRKAHRWFEWTFGTPQVCYSLEVSDSVPHRSSTARMPIEHVVLELRRSRGRRCMTA